MKITTEEPTSGQYVAMWEHNGALWADNRRITSGVKEIFIDFHDENESGDEWVVVSSSYPPDTEITFYQL